MQYYSDASIPKELIVPLKLSNSIAQFLKNKRGSNVRVIKAQKGEKKQLLSLLIYSFVMWTMGNGLMALLPLYIQQLGANESIAGYFMSFAFLCLAVGTLAAGWFSDRFQRRKLLLVVAGLCNVPACFLMGDARFELATSTV